MKLTWWICARLTSMYTQLSVENAIAKRATATIAVIVANDSVTAEQGIASKICVTVTAEVQTKICLIYIVITKTWILFIWLSICTTICYIYTRCSNIKAHTAPTLLLNYNKLKGLLLCYMQPLHCILVDWRSVPSLQAGTLPHFQFYLTEFLSSNDNRY